MKLGLIKRGVAMVKIQEVTPGEVENPTALVN
jgi:hypothetical protein